jgi:hypothetical protein
LAYQLVDTEQLLAFRCEVDLVNGDFPSNRVPLDWSIKSSGYDLMTEADADDGFRGGLVQITDIIDQPDYPGLVLERIVL